MSLKRIKIILFDIIIIIIIVNNDSKVNELIIKTTLYISNISK
jgi:hypothetical protein